MRFTTAVFDGVRLIAAPAFPAPSAHVPLEFETLQSAQEKVRMMLQRLTRREPQIGQAIEQDVERDASLVARQRRPDTKVDAEADQAMWLLESGRLRSKRSESWKRRSSRLAEA